MFPQERACKKAVLTVAFNHPEWEEVDMAQSLRVFADFEIDTSLNEPGSNRGK